VVAMGGYGSGRRAQSTLVEDCRYIDISGMEKHFDSKRWTVLSWTRDGEEWGKISWKYKEKENYIRLRYKVTDRGGKHNYSYKIPIEFTSCYFGGKRPWFKCLRCGERARKLYLPSSRHVFLCRECHNLQYRSSRASGDELETAELRYRRAFQKADKENRRPHPNRAPYYPEKPKGMHWETFNKLTEELRQREAEWEEAFLRRAQELRKEFSEVV